MSQIPRFGLTLILILIGSVAQADCERAFDPRPGIWKRVQRTFRNLFHKPEVLPEWVMPFLTDVPTLAEETRTLALLPPLRKRLGVGLRASVEFRKGEKTALDLRDPSVMKEFERRQFVTGELVNFETGVSTHLTFELLKLDSSEAGTFELTFNLARSRKNTEQFEHELGQIAADYRVKDQKHEMTIIVPKMTRPPPWLKGAPPIILYVRKIPATKAGLLFILDVLKGSTEITDPEGGNLSEQDRASLKQWLATDLEQGQ